MDEWNYKPKGFRLKMSDDKRIKVDASVEYIPYFKDNWGIIKCSIDRVRSGKDIYKGDLIVFKGQMPEPVKGFQYTIVADFESDPKWGDQYVIQSMYTAIEFGDEDDVGKKKYLSSLYTPYQVECMYKALEDPFEALKKRDMESLVKIKGCALKTATYWCHKFHEHYDRAKIYIELEDYNLTNNIVNRLMTTYHSPDLVIDKVKNNPYVLVNEVNGLGWKKADEIALKGGIDPLGETRVAEYIKYYLKQSGNNGMSWLTPDQLLGAILDEIGEEVEDSTITKAIGSLDLWYNEDKTKIGLPYYKLLSMLIAVELLRIKNAESNFKYDGWEKRIKELEQEQGWEFTDEQINGIKMGLENNVLVISGSAGSGKTSLVGGILAAIPDYSHVMCALSGRASARLAEVTGEIGYTIHRLLGYSGAGFKYYQDNQLGYDIYILDEISMVDAELFYYLIRAIPSGSKIIMLGDPAQLEAIGCGNVAYDMINSPEIPDILLTKIHRQAAKSAIITNSTAVRHGEQIVDKDWSGTEVRGELQDLVLDCYLDSSNSFYKVMEYFQRLYSQKDFDIMETQIIVPIKKRGTANTYTLNNDIQELYNPARDGLKEESVMTTSSGLRIFRVGDKVINTVNNYKIEPTVYNGNIGIIKDITIEENEEGDETDIMIIDFVGIGRVSIPKDYWDQLDLAYAITVHKYQGSQSDNIIFNFDFASYSLLTRQLIYTGITRAKKKCYLVCQTGALRYGIAQEAISRKQTHLQDSLYEVAHPKLVF